MKIALVQMSMGKEISENLDKSLKYCDMAENCDLVFFPEIQLTPFFPQYHNICVDHYCIDMDIQTTHSVHCRFHNSNPLDFFPVLKLLRYSLLKFL